MNYMYWFYNIAGLVYLFLAAVGVMWGTASNNTTLQYLGLVSIGLAIYCNVEKADHNPKEAST
jgi:hypothetical protein